MNRLWKLIREFEIKYGRMPFGKELDQLKILANEEETRQKVIRIPEEKLPPFYEARPMEGPKAEVKQFPKEKIVRKPSETTEAGGLERIAKELEDMQEIGKDYKDTSVSDFLSDYFDMPKKSKTPVTDKMQKMLGDVKLYGDETFEELEIIKNTGEHPRKNKSRLLTDDEVEDYSEILGDTETWMDKGTVEEAEAAVKRQKDYEQQMYSEYKVEKQGRKELEDAYKEIDFRMTGEDTKYEANELADMIAEIRFKTEMSDLPQNTQLDLYDEAYNYLMELKRDVANFKGATNIKTGKNIVTGEQEIPIDPMTGKPRKPNANGGRIKNNEGGLNSLKEVYNNVGDFVSKYSGIDSLIKLVEYLDTVGTPEYTADPFNTKPLKKPMRAPKLPEKESKGLDYLQGF
jgi:hypothetical protein